MGLETSALVLCGKKELGRVSTNNKRYRVPKNVKVGNKN